MCGGAKLRAETSQPQLCRPSGLDVDGQGGRQAKMGQQVGR